MTKVQQARAAYDAMKKRIADATGDATVAASMDTAHNLQRAEEAGLLAEFVEVRDAWWNAQSEEHSAMSALNKNEAREVARINVIKRIDADNAQRAADIWMRSAPTDAAQVRRKAAVKALGLSDEIKFL